MLLTNEAIALAAINAGLSGVYAYPGTPSTEITEYIQRNAAAKERGIHSRWCTNEKTAMETALGMSYAGKRSDMSKAWLTISYASCWLDGSNMGTIANIP